MRLSLSRFPLVLAAAAVAAAGCAAQADGEIPCVEDLTCPDQYPVCGPAGKCISGTSTKNASIAILGPEGYTATEFVSGTVRVLVTARAMSGVATVKLASGTVVFPASSPAATVPVYAFDVNTGGLANGDAPLTASVTAGDGSTGTATGVLHVDNTLPAIKITSFSVGPSLAASSGTATISSGGSTKLFASLGRGATVATLSCAPACGGTLSTNTIVSGSSVTVTGSVDGALTYTLTVQPSSGPGDTATVTLNVVPPATATALNASSPVVHHGEAATLTPMFSFGSAPAVAGSAVVVGDDGTTYANLSSGTPIQVAPTRPTTVYTLHVANAAGLAAATAPSATVILATGTWSGFNLDTFAAVRGATVTALDNGKVLVAGGIDGLGTPSNTAYLCDASGACVAKTGAAGMISARAYHTAVKIDAAAANNGGKVLLAGGYTAAGPATPTLSAELYDPATNTFSTTTALSGSARARHIAVLLDASKILIAGGTDGTNTLKSAIKYDAGGAPPTITAVADMAQVRANFTGTLLNSGKVLVVGGATGVLTAELFDPAGTPGSEFSSTGALPAGEDKRFHTATLLSGLSPNALKVLISGGVTGSGSGTPTATQFLYSSSSGTFAAAPSMAIARANHAVISLINVNILLCGGTSTGADTLKTCDLYDHSSGSGAILPTDSMSEARKDFALAPITISSFGEVLAIGGTAGTPLYFAEVYDLN